MMANSLKKHRLVFIIAAVPVAAGIGAFVVFASAKKPADYTQLLGQWARPDGGYVLDIRNVEPDGKLELAYLNPRPINVSKAHANIETGQIKIFVELRDRYYPGSYYTLTYDSQMDRLVGVYHHLGIGQNISVSFLRKPGTI